MDFEGWRVVNIAKVKRGWQLTCVWPKQANQIFQEEAQPYCIYFLPEVIPPVLYPISEYAGMRSHTNKIAQKILSGKVTFRF